MKGEVRKGEQWFWYGAVIHEFSDGCETGVDGKYHRKTFLFSTYLQVKLVKIVSIPSILESISLIPVITT